MESPNTIGVSKREIDKGGARVRRWEWTTEWLHSPTQLGSSVLLKVPRRLSKAL